MGQWDNLTERLGLYRDTQNGWIAGVCAGIGERIGFKPLWIRIGFVLLALASHGIGLAVYFILAFFMKPRAGAEALASPAGVQRAYRDFADTVASPFGAAPGRQVAALKARFGALDSRLNNLEAAVMSDELSLRRKFKDIGG